MSESMAEAPFFIVGAERSGTTLLRLMIDHHPRIACFYEYEFAVDHVTDDGVFPSMVWIREYLSRPLFRETFPEGVPGGVATYTELMQGVLLRKQARDGKSRVGATVHRNFHRLLYLWPDARFIHIVRDGRDVARSRIQMGWDGNAWTAIDEWIEREQDWDDLSARLDPARFHEVRYEDLVADPRRVLSGICQFLGEQYSAEMLAYSNTSTYSAPNPSLSYQWRSKASRQEVQWMEYKAIALLQRRGYDASGLQCLQVTSWQAAALARASRRGRWWFRLRRQGPWLVFLDVFSRRVVRARSLRRYVDERLNEVRLRHLR